MKKVVLDLSGGNRKNRKKAMKVACGAPGVSSVALGGDDKSKLEVTGEGVDAADLTVLLRKELARKCYFLRANNPASVNLESVGPVEKKKEEKQEKEPKVEAGVPYGYNYSQPPYGVYEVHEPGCACSIM